VDGKAAGRYLMTIERRDDGTICVQGNAKVKVSYIVVAYRYSYEGTEVWKDGRLLQLKSSADDDGKAYAVSAWADGNALRVRCNGKEQTTVADVWLTTYWHAPDPQFRNKSIPLVDADNGKCLTAHLQYEGTRQITVMGQPLDCYYYRLTGAGLQVELWYDGHERLVREESLEDGHRMTLELAHMSRP
jgi:hypothetical protein